MPEFTEPLNLECQIIHARLHALAPTRLAEDSDSDALEIAVRLQAEYEYRTRFEAVSVGTPTEITDTPGRLIVRIEERLDGQGWGLHGDQMPSLWYLEVVYAVSYAASRTRGHISEIRIVNRVGKITHIVLMDTTAAYDGRLYCRSPALTGPGSPPDPETKKRLNAPDPQN